MKIKDKSLILEQRVKLHTSLDSKFNGHCRRKVHFILQRIQLPLSSGFLHCISEPFMSPLWDLGDKGNHACSALSNKVLVSDPGLSYLLPSCQDYEELEILLSLQDNKFSLPDIMIIFTNCLFKNLNSTLPELKSIFTKP